jgi:hypothetical protein
MRWTLRFMAFTVNDAPLSCFICLVCAEFLRHIFPRLEWTALKEAAETVCQPAKQTGRIGSAISRRRLCFANSLFSCRVFFMRSLYAWSSHVAPGNIWHSQRKGGRRGVEIEGDVFTWITAVG